MTSDYGRPAYPASHWLPVTFSMPLPYSLLVIRQ